MYFESINANYILYTYSIIISSKKYHFLLLVTYVLVELRCTICKINTRIPESIQIWNFLKSLKNIYKNVFQSVQYYLYHLKIWLIPRGVRKKPFMDLNSLFTYLNYMHMYNIYIIHYTLYNGYWIYIINTRMYRTYIYYIYALYIQE